MKKIKRNKKGGISIETTVVSAIILTAGVVGIVYVNDKLDDSKKELADNVEEQYENKDLVVNIHQDDGTDDRTINNDSNILLEEEEKDELQLVNLTFNLPLNELQERTTTITLDSLKEIESIKASNGGKVEIISIDGDDVTIRVTGGDVKERVVVRGQYIAAQTKFVTKQENPNYTDVNGYSGTLTRYLDSYSPAYTKAITMSPTNLTNNFPATILYVENDLTTTLTKSGASISKVIKGSESKSKTVTAQPSASYSETINDNGVTTRYTGTLTRYVYSGEETKSKTSTTSQSNTTNSFPATMTYQDGNYSGTLSKSGSSTSVVTKGSPSASKNITGYPNKNYLETVNDNGITAYYSGTLTAYVSKGSASTSKTASKQVGHVVNEFDDTIPYEETVTDNNKTTIYTGTLTKNGNAVESVIKGSASATKKVNAQTSPNYEEKINDNGIETTYTGTLTEYVYQGSISNTKTGRDSRTNTTNVFNDTIPYSETINDNGIETKYTGTLSKSGNPTTTVRAGSNVASKNVTGQTSKDYYESINDNGVSTAYSGTLTAYVNKGSDIKSKTGYDSRTNTTGTFDNTIPYSETVNDNNKTASYSGTLSKFGDVTKTVRVGSDKLSKNVSGQFGPNYSEYVYDNGIYTYYTGTLNAYVNRGSAYASKTVYDSQSNTTNSFPATMDYSEYVNDNGVSTNYNGTLYKYGNVSSVQTGGSAGDSKYVTGQTSYYYSDNTGYSGYLSSYEAILNQRTQSDSRTDTVANNFPYSIQYNSGGYSGTLYKTTSSSRVTRGSAANSNTAKVSTVGYYNYGYHCVGSGTSQKVEWKTESEGAMEYLGLSNLASTTKYASGTYYDNGVYVSVGGNVPFEKKTQVDYRPPNNWNNVVGVLPIGSCNGTVTRATQNRYTVMVTWSGYVYKKDTREYEYTQNYSGTVYQKGTRYQGTVYKPDTRTYRYTQSYSGTASKPDTRQYLYSGTVTKPDTRQYNYTQNYSGTVTKPDTREYLYSGTVTKPDTRLYNYTQAYSGNVSKPNTIVTRYQGDVSKPDTREYGYTQNYTGTVTKPDTREYLYSGTVTKPDTRQYLYTQVYTGTTYTPDTRVYRYQGTVTKSDTRVYEYTQNYTGMLNVPVKEIYLYKGEVIKPASDTRVFKSLYQYDINAKYYK